MSVTCGGQLGLEFGPAGQLPRDDQACNLEPTAFGTCDVTSFSATAAVRCVALTAP